MLVVMDDLLKRCLLKSQEMIRNIIEIEMGYINNNHPDFINTLTNVKNESKKNVDSDSSSKMDYNLDYNKPLRKTQKIKHNSEIELYNSKLMFSQDKGEKPESNPQDAPADLKYN